MNQPHTQRSAFVLSLPERATRAIAAVGGGLIYEASEVFIPGSLRHTHLYQATIARLLRITIELFGGVAGVYEGDTISANELMVRKVAGNVLEAASLIAVGWSPLWLLAAAADLSGGTRIYLATLVHELKQKRVLPADAQIDSVDDLLQRLERTSGTIADAVDIPPMNIGDMRTSWELLRQQASDLPSRSDMALIFASMQRVAAHEQRSLLAVSSAIALGAVRAGVAMGNTYIFSYYQQALNRIAREGWARYLQRVTRPYFSRAVHHFDRHAPTYTERLLGWLDQHRSRPAAADAGNTRTTGRLRWPGWRRKRSPGSNT